MKIYVMNELLTSAALTITVGLSDSSFEVAKSGLTNIDELSLPPLFKLEVPL